MTGQTLAMPRRVARGYVAAQPLALGGFTHAVTFGLLARNAGLSILEALFMSAAVYSGSAQTATVAASQPTPASGRALA
jgi:predicted branched-subunit amino acid permease